MGMNNRQRRAAKARKRARATGTHNHRPGHRAWAGEPLSSTPGDRFVAGVYAQLDGDAATMERAVELLASAASSEVAAEVTPLLEDQMAALWDRGWQPADVLRLVDRDLGKLEGVLVRRVLAAQAASYEHLGRRVAREWMAQLERSGATRSWDGSVSYVRQLGVEWSDVLHAAIRLAAFWLHAPALPRLIDPPSAWRDGPVVDERSLPSDMLAKVRALLAKAESTTFETEAEALTAKAQELMARHRINRALLDAGAHQAGEEPIGRRIGVDNPYADAKAVLLGEVAHANGCKAVWSKQLGFTTVFGYRDELDGVEELFTSLLVQATGALQRTGSKVDGIGRSRTTRYRRSFLVAFALRIGERLRGLVEDQQLRIAQKPGGDTEPLLHSQRVGAVRVMGPAGEADPFEHRGDLSRVEPSRRGQPSQVLRARQGRIERGCVDDGADTRQIRGRIRERMAEYGPVPAARAEQPQDDPQRRRLAGSVRTDEARHRTARHAQVQAVDRKAVSEALGQ
jgi:hypothetical protein